MAGALRIEVAVTSALPPRAIEAVRALMDVAFDGRFSDDDWAHSVGGTHALLWDGDGLVAHASVVERRLHTAGRSLHTGYVEAVAVQPARQRQGHGGRVMDEIERVIRGTYEVGALSASAAGFEFYRARGWLPWRGETSVETPDGLVRTEEDDGAVLVLPLGAPLDLDAPIACEWRAGDAW